MNTRTKLGSVVILTMALLWAAVYPALAQDGSPVSATVDRNVLTTGESLVLEVSVDAGSGAATAPQLPALAAFHLLDQSSATQIALADGKMSASTVYRYRLQPAVAGDLVIGPVQVTVDDQSYQTAPIAVQVSQGSGQSQPATPGLAPSHLLAPLAQPGDDLFVEAAVDQVEPYVGQQVVYTFRFYEALDALRLPSLFADQPSYQAPAMTGFWAEGDPEQTNYQATAHGRVYNVTELRTHLFPTAAGEVTVEPAQLTFPGSPFQAGSTLQTDAIQVTVKPLPAGAPASFGGAVGQFELQAAVDTSQTRVNEPVTWQVVLSGLGNLGTAADPIWPKVDGWRGFSGGENATGGKQTTGAVAGNRVFTRVLVPTQPGDFTLPPMEYSYFDPADAAYHTLTTDPIGVTVAPGPVAATNDVPADDASATADDVASADDAATTASDPAPAGPGSEWALKPIPAALRLAGRPLAAQPWYWTLWAIPMVALVGGLSWRRWELARVRRAADRRRSHAHARAQRALARARGAETADAKFAAAEQSLRDYLGAKLAIPATTLSGRAIAAKLQAHGVGPELAEQTAHCLHQAESGRYNPAASDRAQADGVLEETAATITALDSTL